VKILSIVSIHNCRTYVPAKRFGEVITDFNNIARFQGRLLAHEIEVIIGGRKIFPAVVENASALAVSDPSLTPAPDAKLLNVEKLCDTAGTMIGHLLKKRMPVYPLEARQRLQQGTVLIQVTIGTDGKVHDPEVELVPSPALAAAALDAVSHCEYQPTTVNGEPVEMETMVRVIFSIGD
jgi:TonB family protein